MMNGMSGIKRTEILDCARFGAVFLGMTIFIALRTMLLADTPSELDFLPIQSRLLQATSDAKFVNYGSGNSADENMGRQSTFVKGLNHLASEKDHHQPQRCQTTRGSNGVSETPQCKTNNLSSRTNVRDLIRVPNRSI